MPNRKNSHRIWAGHVIHVITGRTKKRATQAWNRGMPTITLANFGGLCEDDETVRQFFGKEMGSSRPIDPPPVVDDPNLSIGLRCRDDR